MKNIWFVGVMLGALVIPLASSLIWITKDIRTQNTINETTKEFLWNIEPKIKIENLSYDTIEGVRNVSLSIKVPQEVIADITGDSKEDLSKQLAGKLNKDVALDVSITPVTSVTKKEAKILSPEEKIRQWIQIHLTEEYKNVIDLISVDYYTDAKRFAIVNLYTETNIKNKEVFEADLYDYLQEQEDLIDIILLSREENYTEPEKIREQKDDDMDLIKDSFATNFIKETKINNLDLLYVTDTRFLTRRPSILAAINITTTQDQETITQQLEDRKENLQIEIGTQIELEVIVEYLEKLSL